MRIPPSLFTSGLRVLQRTALLVATTILLANAPGAMAAKGHGGGGGGGDTGGGTGPVCALFDDLPGDSVQSDGAGSYCDGSPRTLAVEFSNDGHFGFDTNTSNRPGTARNLFFDFGAPISILDRAANVWTFATTDDLDDAGVPYDVNFTVGAWQEINMLTMQPGDSDTHVNLMIYLHVYFPGDKGSTPVFIKLAPEPLSNDRQCEASDPVAVTYLGVDPETGLRVWRVETMEFDDDGDGSFNEDPIDGIDNDGDGATDEDAPGNKTAVSQDPYGHSVEQLTVGIRNFNFGFFVTQ